MQASLSRSVIGSAGPQAAGPSRSPSMSGLSTLSSPCPYLYRMANSEFCRLSEVRRSE